MGVPQGPTLLLLWDPITIDVQSERPLAATESQSMADQYKAFNQYPSLHNLSGPIFGHRLMAVLSCPCQR